MLVPKGLESDPRAYSELGQLAYTYLVFSPAFSRFTLNPWRPLYIDSRLKAPTGLYTNPVSSHLSPLIRSTPGPLPPQHSSATPCSFAPRTSGWLSLHQLLPPSPSPPPPRDLGVLTLQVSAPRSPPQKGPPGQRIYKSLPTAPLPLTTRLTRHLPLTRSWSFVCLQVSLLLEYKLCEGKNHICLIRRVPCSLNKH